MTGTALWAHISVVEPEGIPASSRRQAMDWSLVLLSQGIEHTVERSEDERVWELRVTGSDRQNALHAIRQYQSENRHWLWRRQLIRQGILFDWASLAWAALACAFYWLTDLRPGLRLSGLMDAAAVSHGQWWRLFTAIWLHADLSHLASNAVLGFVLLGLTMASYGPGIGLLAAYLAGASGNALAWLIAPQPRFSLGASGMVMGSLGLLAIQSAALWRRAPSARKYILSGIVAGVMLFLLLGTAPDSDLLAHAGGFISGLIAGGLWIQIPRLTHRSGLNLICGLLFGLLVIGPWWLALRFGLRN